MADWSWLLLRPFWLSQMGTGGLPDDSPIVAMAVAFGGRGGPICHLKSGTSPVTEMREKISCSRERFLQHLYDCLWFFRSTDWIVSPSHRCRGSPPIFATRCCLSMILCPKILAKQHGHKTNCGLKSHDSRKRDTSFRTGSLDQLRRWTLPVGCLKLQRQETKTSVIQWCKQRQRRWCWKWWICALTWTLYAEAERGGQPFCPSVTFPRKNVSDLTDFGNQNSPYDPENSI